MRDSENKNTGNDDLHLLVCTSEREVFLVPAEAQSGHVAYKKGRRNDHGRWSRRGVEGSFGRPFPSRGRCQAVVGFTVCVWGGRKSRTVTGPPSAQPGGPSGTAGSSGKGPGDEEEEEERASGL